jgi:hypothetical protein
MPADIPELLATVRQGKNRYAANEQATKQGIVLPLFARLGWDRDDVSEVAPEYAVGSGRVDYCLKRGSECLVFVEVKRVAEPLDGHQEQLLRYAFEQGVDLAVLTDGMRWWLYLPTQSGSWEQRRFFMIDLEEQTPEHVASHLRRYLGKPAVLDGTALRAAQELHTSRTKELRIREAIPTAWQDLCEEADAGLIELLSEKVEGLCGHKPNPEKLEEFIAQVGARYERSEQTGIPRAKRPRGHTSSTDATQSRTQSDQWTFQKPRSFTFLGQVHEVTTFKAILVELAQMLQTKYPIEFWNRVGELQRGRGRRYFTREPDGLQEPREIGQTGIYMETCLSANAVRDRCYELLGAFDLPPDALTVELRPKA